MIYWVKESLLSGVCNSGFVVLVEIGLLVHYAHRFIFIGTWLINISCYISYVIIVFSIISSGILRRWSRQRGNLFCLLLISKEFSFMGMFQWSQEELDLTTTFHLNDLQFIFYVLCLGLNLSNSLLVLVLVLELLAQIRALAQEFHCCFLNLYPFLHFLNANYTLLQAKFHFFPRLVFPLPRESFNHRLIFHFIEHLAILLNFDDF